VSVRYAGMQVGNVEFDGGRVDSGVWILFSPSVIDLATGQEAYFPYDPQMRQNPGFNSTHMMSILSWTRDP